MKLSKPQILLLVLGFIFLTNALLAEFIGVKIFSLEETLGLKPLNWALPSFNLTAGVVLWPVVFVMTDIINEYFGFRVVKFLSFAAVVAISFAFLMISFSISLTPSDFWISAYETKGVKDMQNAYNAVLGQGAWIIVGSLIAFLVGQLLDVLIFQQIKKVTGEKMLWLRATGSTLLSQLVDSFIVLFVAFYLSGIMSLGQVLAIGVVNYIFKFIVAVVLTPVLYFIHYLIDMYLGKEKSLEMRTAAKMT